MPASTVPVSVRVSTAERDLLELAAAQARTTFERFRPTQGRLRAAEADLVDRRIVVIPAVAWDAFEAWAQAPARPVPELRKLAEVTPAWES